MFQAMMFHASYCHLGDGQAKCFDSIEHGIKGLLRRFGIKVSACCTEAKDHVQTDLK